jgi:hypothetical protein
LNLILIEQPFSGIFSMRDGQIGNGPFRQRKELSSLAPTIQHTAKDGEMTIAGTNRG